MVKLITTDSYFNLFPILVDQIKGHVTGLDQYNLVFCDEKSSLYVERFLCGKLKGSFNTDVYSFGNFLRVHKRVEKLLSKEGSAMAIKRILSSVSLKCFKSGKSDLSPVLFDLISQLKSAKIGVSELENAIENTGGILKRKLEDVALVFSKYEQLIEEKGYDDQSSMLSYLPEIIENSEKVKNSNVFLVGFSGWTRQVREAVSSLLKTSKNVTAILVEGKNDSAYVNETSCDFRALCKEKDISLTETHLESDYSIEAKTVTNGLFDPTFIEQKIQTEKVYKLSAKNPQHEISAIAQNVRSLVMSGKYRYKDVALALGNQETYKEEIKKQFNLLGIPYFLDDKKKVDSHPLITLILAYIDCFKFNFEKSALKAFYKNPLFNNDKVLSDEFDNYILRYKINYGRIKKPLTLAHDGKLELSSLEQFRQKICSHFESFSVRKLLKELDVESKLEKSAETLRTLNRSEESAICAQIYSATLNILDEMTLLLGENKLSYGEYKTVFQSGISALEMSIIPQNYDAVFIGDYKQIALGKNKCLFACGLTSAIPSVKEDVALLSDGDIDKLEQIKILVEPKIRIVNHRQREQVVSALSSFDERIYVSYPVCETSGKKNVKGEIFTFLDKNFTTKDFDLVDEYLTKKQGVESFAKSCSEFADGKINDFSEAASFYKAVNDEKLQFILDKANKTVKIRLDGKRDLITGKTSPTTIENYYKCPYYAFLSHVVGLKAREEGEIDNLSIGNLFHNVLEEYAKKLGNGKIDGKDSSNKAIEKSIQEVLSREEFKRYLEDTETYSSINRVLDECKKYCDKTYLSFKNSLFKVEGIEKKFGDGKDDYPAIPLLGGEIKLTGKIDRVDTYGDYFRVVDYKTGATSVDDKLLFNGTKLQLYLYGAVIKDKQLAGAYYLKISDEYRKDDLPLSPLAKGKTLNEEQAINAQDVDFLTKGTSEFLPLKIDEKGLNDKDLVDRETISAYVNYALKVCEKGAKNIQDGVIIASPTGRICDYCKYKAMCADNVQEKREVNNVDQEFIKQSVKEDESCQN